MTANAAAAPNSLAMRFMLVSLGGDVPHAAMRRVWFRICGGASARIAGLLRHCEAHANPSGGGVRSCTFSGSFWGVLGPSSKREKEDALKPPHPAGHREIVRTWRTFAPRAARRPRP